MIILPAIPPFLPEQRVPGDEEWQEIYARNVAKMNAIPSPPRDEGESIRDHVLRAFQFRMDAEIIAKLAANIGMEL